MNANTTESLRKKRGLEQLKLAEELKNQPSRIVTTELEGATSYELSMPLRYFGVFKEFEYKENEKGVLKKVSLDSRQHVVIDKGEDGKQNDMVIVAECGDIAREISDKYGIEPKFYNHRFVEPAYRELDCVYFNSIKNPINKTVGSKKPTLNNISFKEFDDGNVHFCFTVANVVFRNKKDNTFTANISKHDKYVVKIERGQPVSIEKNGKLILDDSDVEEFFKHSILFPFYMRPENMHEDFFWFREKIETYLLVEDFVEHDIENNWDTAVAFNSYYKAMRNELLSDLPWDNAALGSLYRPDREVKDKKPQAFEEVMRYLQAGDTVNAVDACFYGAKFPKALRKFLIARTRPLQYNPKVYQNLQACCEVHGVNKTIDLLLTNDGQLNQRVFKFYYLIEAMLLGFSYNEFNRYLKDDAQEFDSFKGLVVDVLRMNRRLEEAGVEVDVDVKKITEYHDAVIPAHSALKATNNSAELIAFRTVATDADTAVFKYDKYVIRAPKNAFELIGVGSDMSHCVASYAKDYFYKNLDIFLVTNKLDGSYVACLECRDKLVRQAKLSHNRLVRTDPEVLEAVNEWMKHTGMLPATKDLLDSTDDWSVEAREHVSNFSETSDKDPERVAIVEDIAKQLANGKKRH